MGSDACTLLSGVFALSVQGVLGITAVLSLVYKRFVERPRRPLRIWSFDVGKQVVGAAVAHVSAAAPPLHVIQGVSCTLPLMCHPPAPKYPPGRVAEESQHR